MSPVIRNILAVLCGILLGGLLNMGIILISGSIIPPPEGANLTTMEGLKEAMHLMGPQHFLMPFLAHALGSFVGSLVAALLATKHKMRYALGISGWFFIGGLLNILMLPSPWWFTIVDLLFAYLPMGYLAARLVTRRSAAIK